MRSVLVLFVATTVLADESPRQGEKLFPLAVGNTWTYRVSGQSDRFIVRAAAEEKVGEQKCMRLEAMMKGRVVAREWVAFTASGLCRFREDEEDINPPLCVLRLSPPRKGWNTKFQLGSRSATANFFSVPSEVNVPLGRFNSTLVVSYLNEVGPRLPSTSNWYVEGIGVVRQEIRERNGPPLVLELEKFETATSK